MTDFRSNPNDDPGELKQLIDEQQRVAEIGRLVGSTLDIAEVFPQLAVLSQALVSADRMVISFLTEDGSELVDQFVDGAGSENTQPKARTPVITDNQYSELIQANIAYVRTGENLENFNKESADERSRQALGFKSLMVVPLSWQGSSYGLLSFRAFDPDAFGNRQIDLGQQIASQIAGGVASANQIAKVERESREKEQIAEIGRLVGSTLDISEVFPQLAETARTLVSADRMVISIVSEDGLELVDRHVDGFIVPDDEFKGRRLISESDAYQSLIVDNVPAVYSGDDLNKYNTAAREETARKQTGLKALMMIPLMWQGDSYGVIAFRAFDSDAFGSHQVELARQITNQVAGGVASANQYAELERESLEKEQLAEIRKIAGSSLDIEEIFASFAKQTRTLVPAERLILTTIDADGDVINRYTDGLTVRDSTAPTNLVLDDAIFKKVGRDRTYFVANGEEYEKYVVDRVFEVNRYAAGLRAILSIPLSWRDDLVGSITFRSTDPEAYGARDIEIAQQIANQIASAIHASNQYRLLEKEALNRSRLGDIGKIVSSTLELDSVFSAFVETARELVPFDRLAISLIDAQSGHISSAHVADQTSSLSHRSDVISLETSIVPTSVYRDFKVLVSSDEDLADRAKSDIADDNRKRIAEGYISAMIVPVVLQANLVGTLIFRSIEPDPYTTEHVELAEQIAAQIAGLIASSQQRSLLQAESTERRRLGEIQSRIAEIGRIVNSTLDLDKVFSLIVEQARELVQFDRVVVTLLSEDRQSMTDEFVDGPGNADGLELPFGYNSIQKNVVETGESYVRNGDDDVVIEDENDLGARALGLNSVLISPLIWQQNVYGLLSFRSKEMHAYDEHQLDLADQIAAQIAGAIAMSQQYQQLAQSEATYREFVDNAHIIVWRMDSEGRFSYVNKAFEDVLGYSPSEIIGTNYWNVQSASRRGDAEERFTKRMKTAANNSGETIYIHKSGAEVHLNFSSYPMLDPDGIAIGVRGVALDVTAERQAQDELKIQAAALEEASDAVVILLPDTTIGYVNNAFVEQTGYSKAESIGQPSSILRSASSSSAVYERIWEMVREGKIWRGTIFGSRKNGSTFAIDASLNPVFGEDGSISSYVSIRRDITERVQAEQDKQARAELDAQNQQLQEMNEERDEFFSTVSHELRTPLTAVTAFSDILSRNRGGNLTSSQLDQLDVIRRNSRSLINLVEDMLDMSRLNSRSLRMDRASFDLDEMILSTIESLEPTARERNQSLKFSSSTEGLSIDADKSRLIQVLSNLLTNACKYSAKDTRIDISTSTDGDWVEFKVVDSGIGMSAIDLNGLFSPFYRSGRDEVRAQAGTGLGMSISKTLVELHDGSIEVESVIDEGTTVTVRLPSAINVSDSTM